MLRVVVSGLPSVAEWLERRLPGAFVKPAGGAEETLAELARGKWDLLVIDDRTDGTAETGVVAQLRGQPGLAGLPVLYCLASHPDGERARRLVGELGVRELLLHPLDLEELARHVTSVAGVPLPPPAAETEPDREEREELVGIWDKYRPQREERLAAIERACLAARTRTWGPELARAAQAAAHWVAGSASTFGYPEGTRLARLLEKILGAPGAPDGERASEIAELFEALQAELARPPAPSPSLSPRPASAPEAPGVPYVLVVDDDFPMAVTLAWEAGARGLRAEAVQDAPAARAAIARECPSMVLLDLQLGEDRTAGFALLAELSARVPPVPVLLYTISDGFTDRVEAARLGARAFLRKPMAPGEVIGEVAAHLERARSAQPHVMAVDDDPALLAVLAARVAAQGIRVTTLDDPLRFWDVLAEARPDLLVLDVEMPHVSGIELCRVVRSDARWSRLPVLFLTSHSEPEIVERLFGAGADDYVRKPIIGAELLNRITNRLDRVRLLRRLAETDFLTGVSNRQHAGEAVEDLLRLAERHGQPVSLAILDLDRFKRVNDTHGHAVGDAVLARLGRLLARTFRGEDVIARWGGEEFLVGMFGMRRRDGVERLAQALEAWRQEEFTGADGTTFHSSFSSGIAEYPADGASLDALYRAADGALYRAKDEGRDRIIPASRALAPEGAADVALACSDEATAALVLRALETRGYRVVWSRDTRAPGAAGWQMARALVTDGDLALPERHAAKLIPLARPLALPDLLARVRSAVGDPAGPRPS